MKTKLKAMPQYIAAAIVLAVVVFLVTNPIAAKYLVAMVGGSIQYGHL